jgi:hypothetical protein
VKRTVVLHLDCIFSALSIEKNRGTSPKKINGIKPLFGHPKYIKTPEKVDKQANRSNKSSALK